MELDQLTYNQIVKELKDIEMKYNVKLVGEVEIQTEYDYYYEESVDVIYPYIAILNNRDQIIGKIFKDDGNEYIRN